MSGEHSSIRGCERIQNSTDSKAPSSDVLSEVLVLPRPIARAKSRGKQALNSHRTMCMTNDEILRELKLKDFDKAEAERRKKPKS